MNKFLLSAAAALAMAVGVAGAADAYDHHGGGYYGHGGHGYYGHGGGYYGHGGGYYGSPHWHGPVVIGARPYAYYPAYYPAPLAYYPPAVIQPGISLGVSLR